MEVATNTKQKYDSYKDSGVEWLGQIPGHWAIRRIKYLFKEINKRSTEGNENLLSVSQYTGVTIKNVEEGELLTNAASLEGYKKVSKGNLVTNIMLAWNGSLGFSPFDGITSPAYSIYKLIGKNNKRYFHYLLRTNRYKAEFKRNSSGVIESRLRLYTDDFFRIFSLVPPLQEQKAIASFLNQKTSQLDRAVAQKEALIELLKERKQILIQNAVTGKVVWSEKEQKMIPLALSGVEGKDSGVEWIGEIPEHWEVKRLKFVTRLISEKIISKESKLEYVGMENIESWSGKFVPSNSETEGLANYFKEGDILFGKLRPYLAKVYLAEKEGICTTEFLVYRVKKSINNSYLFILLLSFEFINLIDSSTYGSKMPRANSDFIGNQMIPIPPLSEQKEIAAYIENESQKIEQAITLQQAQIKKLKEYKQSLIDAAVTGKVRVG